MSKLPAEQDEMPDEGEQELAAAFERAVTRMQQGQSLEACDESPECFARIADLAPLISAIDRLPLHQAVFHGSDVIPADWHPPVVLGDYRLLQELGRGGMGIVFEAEQQSLQRRVAIKLLPGGRAFARRPHRMVNFQLEARIAASLNHPHIVRVYEVGVEQNIAYYTMQLVRGPSLDRVIHEIRRHAIGQRGDHRKASELAEAVAHLINTTISAQQKPSAIPWKRKVHARNCAGDYYLQVAQLGIQAAEALHYAHRHGVVHRDVKPANLLLDSAYHLWVTDFGVAHLQAHPPDHADGVLVGTLRYMSPEQARGACELDARSDVYSLGATLYELVALRPLFESRDRTQLLSQIANAAPPHLDRVRPDVPAELATIIMKAIDKTPHKRFDSARAFAVELKRYLAAHSFHPFRCSSMYAAIRSLRNAKT